MTPERQKKIDDLHRRSNRVLEVVMGALLLLGATVLLKPLLAALGFDMEDYAWFAIIKAIYKYTGIILGILTILAIVTTGFLSYLSTDEEKDQRNEEQEYKISYKYNNFSHKKTSFLFLVRTECNRTKN